MLRAILNKSWRQNLTNTNCTATCLLSRNLFKLDEPDMQDTAGEAGTNSEVMYSYGPPHMAVQKQDDQHEHTFSNYVRIQDVVQKTFLRRWTRGKSGERGSGVSVLPARHDDDDLILIIQFDINHYFTCKWSKIFLTSTNCCICIQLNDFKYRYLLFAHS